MKTMRAMGKVLLAAACVAAMAQGQTLKQDPTTKLRFKNMSDNAIWITIYVGDSRTGNVARNCVLPNQEITLDGSGKVLQQLWYNLLAEVKESGTTCANHSNKYEIYREHIGDTRVAFRKPTGSGQLNVTTF